MLFAGEDSYNAEGRLARWQRLKTAELPLHAPPPMIATPIAILCSVFRGLFAVRGTFLGFEKAVGREFSDGVGKQWP